jgi:NAD(P)-dependent dehydrogenase (short-subunit alcohol dehydrogenase family)
MGHLEERLGLTGKVAVVAGGAGGLGRACVDELAAAGMDLAVCDRDGAALAATVDRHRGGEARVVTVEGDVRDPEVLDALFSQADDAFGRVDVLVNVVGGTFHQSFVNSNPRGWDGLTRTNFTWLLTSTQLAVPRMRAVGGGSIVNFTTSEAHHAAPGFAVYAALKSAVTSLTRTLAVELGPDRIRVNCIAPKIVPTEAMGAIGAEAAAGHEQAARLALPLGRVGTYADIGGCVLFLASDLSEYVTGTTLHPDGGGLAATGWLNWPGAGWTTVPPSDRLESSPPEV